jgi:hypothetical protein
MVLIVTVVVELGLETYAALKAVRHAAVIVAYLWHPVSQLYLLIRAGTHVSFTQLLQLLG